MGTANDHVLSTIHVVSVLNVRRSAFNLGVLAKSVQGSLPRGRRFGVQAPGRAFVSGCALTTLITVAQRILLTRRRMRACAPVGKLYDIVDVEGTCFKLAIICRPIDT